MKIQYDIEARRQIGEIFKYGKVKFGIQIALKYKEKLREKINTLKQNPLIGNKFNPSKLHNIISYISTYYKFADFY